MEGSVQDFRMVGEHVYDGMVFHKAFPKDVIDAVKTWNMSGDIIVTSYPRTGTTWTQEIVSLVMNEGDISKTDEVPLDQRYNFIEVHPNPSMPTPLQKAAQTQKPQLLKTHLPAQFISKNLNHDAKVILIIRNPKDAAVSMFHFYKSIIFMNFPGNWDKFFELYKTKHMVYGDFFDWYSSWVPFLDHRNLLFLKYENLIADLNKTIKDVADFLGKQIPDSKMDALVDHLSIKNLRNNQSVNPENNPAIIAGQEGFIRKGGVGGWKSYMNQGQSDYLDQRYEETLKAAGIELRFE